MNVDYAICEALQQMSSSDRVLAIYDIACQWSIHFDERVEAGEMLRKPQSQTMIPAIGKFHLGAHVPECFPMFTLNFIKGAAQIDGEILETLWWPIDRIASVTRAMTKAHRREVLDDNMYDSNWNKWLGISRHTCVFFAPEAYLLTTSICACKEAQESIKHGTYHEGSIRRVDSYTA